MKFRKTIKKILALGTGATMMGATLMGAMAADLANYPAPFVSGGKFSGVMVVGDNANAADVIGVTDIATSLQFAVSGAKGGSAVSVAGDVWKVGTSTKILELSENHGTVSANESIATITTQSFIDDSELPETLANGVVSNSKGDAPYEQRMYFEDTTTGFVTYVEDSDDVTADFLYFTNGRQLARYELEFTTQLESDVDDSAGSASTTGTYLTDIEDSEIEMLGQKFTIVQARRNAAAGNGVQLILMGGATRDTLLEGVTKTYTIDGKDYEVTLDFVDSNSAKFTVNGESTRDLVDGDTDKMSDGTTLGVTEILYQDYAGGVHSADFFLGAQKLEIKDTNIGDTASTQEVKVDDETIDGANAWVEGTDDNSTFKVDKIVVNMSADDDYYVPAGGKLSANPELNEPELLFTKGWDIQYAGLTQEATEEINIKASGSDKYELEFTDGSGNKVAVPIAYTSGTTNLK
ncbi:hypothetical protein J4212_02460, partial [Candidatus Woesearchaeota archaeon]|nr:hypothetical protein [Candidatus Woesearchaeota archaeon]